MGKANLYERIEVLDSLPPEIRRGRGLDDDTKQIIEAINDNKGKVIKLKFDDRKKLLRAYYRLSDCKKKKIVDYKKMHRVDHTLYIVT